MLKLHQQINISPDIKFKDPQRNNDILELLEGLVVQIETRVSSQVQFLKLGGQILWKSDLAQLITAQIHTLTTNDKMSSHTNAHALQAKGLIGMCCCYWLTFISISCMTSGKTSIALEWAMSVCIRRQFMMVVGTVFSMFPLRSTSSSSSSLAILLTDKTKEKG